MDTLTDLPPFKTQIFEKSRKKTRKRLLYNSGILVSILLVILLFFIGFPGIGIVTGISLIVLILKIKADDDKYMGISAYGERRDTIIIATDHLVVRDKSLPFSDLEDLTIYVDEYAGMAREIYGTHHGGNNEITFKYQGEPYSIYYIIKNKDDYKRVEKLVEYIENENV